MCTIDYPKFIVSNLKEEFISIQTVNAHEVFNSSNIDGFASIAKASRDISTEKSKRIFVCTARNRLSGARLIFEF